MRIGRLSVAVVTFIRCGKTLHEPDSGRETDASAAGIHQLLDDWRERHFKILRIIFRGTLGCC